MSAPKFDFMVVGAGIAGLAAARLLQSAGHPTAVLESNAKVGGRIATYRHGNCRYDYGAQNLKGADRDLAKEASALGLKVRPIVEPVWLHEAGITRPGDPAANAEAKWTYEGGLDALPERLAAGLTLCFNVTVNRLIESSGEVLALDISGNTVCRARRAVLAVPAPIAAGILERSETRAKRAAPLLREAQYSRCLTVMLEFEPNLADWPYYALIASDRSHPLLWLARENCKGYLEAGTGLVAQLGPAISEEMWSHSEEKIVDATLCWVAEVCGQSNAHPTWSRIHRWPHAQPLHTISFDAANQGSSNIVICGDAVARARVPDAYASGLKAARKLLAI